MPARKHVKPRKAPVNARKVRRNAELNELTDLEARTRSPADMKVLELKEFCDLPISKRTIGGLTSANFIQMTDIQRESLPMSLCGRDVLGAAKTGSGKTLAFIIPILERLYRAKWSQDDGLGALVISPTRELALQTFQVLRKVGGNHSFSAGLIIGGKDVKGEKERLNRMNILIATPGRLLQHMDETAGFSADHLQILVLDEADRILDMGFEKSVNAIVDFLPTTRQTLLFSATQTKSISDLARLSLKNSEYISVHEKAESSTPTQLTQAYVVTPLQDKMDVLYSFIRSHLQHKSLVFLSSCKQVRFVYEAFRKMRPGVPLLHLHGKQKQLARMSVYDAFSKAKAAVLFATDIAARGLDFPAVHWVVQADAPEDLSTYIHRVGRTARYQDGGNALMLLLPSEEEGMLSLLKEKVPTLRRIKVNPVKTVNVKQQLQSLCSEYTDIKYLAQKTFVTYVKSIYLQSNKAVFDVNALPLAEFAEALGLPGTPKIKFLQKKRVVAALAAAKAAAAGSDEEGPTTDGEKKAKTRVDRMLMRKNTDILSAHYSSLIDRSEDTNPRKSAEEEDDEERKPGQDRKVARGLPMDSDQSSDEDDDQTVPPAIPLVGGDDESDDESDDDLLKIKRKDHELEGMIDSIKVVPNQAPSHRRVLREREKARSKLPAPEKVLFDEEGRPVSVYALEDEKEFRKAVGDVDAAASKYLGATRDDMRTADVDDKAAQKERLREKKLAKRMRESAAAQNAKAEEDGPMVFLGANEDEGAGSYGGQSEDIGCDHAARSKRQRHGKAEDVRNDGDCEAPDAKRLAMDEELALKLLQS